MKQPATLMFVCQNLRDANDPKGSCTRRGSQAVLERMRSVRGELGLKSELRVMGATCLGCCESGVTVLCVDAQAGATFYGRMDPDLGEALIRNKHAAGPDTALVPHRLRPDDLLDLSALEAAQP